MTKFISIPLASLLLVTTITLAEEVDPLTALLGGTPTTSETETSTEIGSVDTGDQGQNIQVPAEKPATKEEVASIYVANFNRAPDSEGLNYWVDSKVTIEAVAMSFYDQPETKELYPEGYSNADFVNKVYENLFNREPDTEGFEYWADSLDKGSVSKSVFILAVVNGALGDDKTMMEKKRDVGLEFAASGKNDVDEAREVISQITVAKDISNSYNNENDIIIIGGENEVNIKQ